jgi:leucyl aminopeptidase
MGRKSSLTDEQWAEIGKRLLEGEGPSEIARELTAGGLKVTESTIRSHFERKGQKTKTIQQVASQLFDADQAQRAAQQCLQSLPPAAQMTALTLSQRMRNISEDLANAAENSAKTALRFTALANEQAHKVDDAEPTKATESLKNSVLLTKAANEAAHIPLNLLAANRETVKRINEEPPPAAEEITPERLQQGARRIAFTLHRAAALEKA